MINKVCGSVKQKGATLVELIIAMVIISVAVTGILAAFRITVSNSADPMTRKQAELVAENLMDEVTSKAFTKPSGGFTGPFTVANRDQFDTVSDYNNLTINGVTSLTGTSIAELSTYNATITVTNVALGAIPSSDVVQVRIQVTGPNDNFVLRGYRINYE